MRRTCSRDFLVKLCTWSMNLAGQTYPRGFETFWTHSCFPIDLYQFVRFVDVSIDVEVKILRASTALAADANLGLWSRARSGQQERKHHTNCTGRFTSVWLRWWGNFVSLTDHGFWTCFSVVLWLKVSKTSPHQVPRSFRVAPIPRAPWIAKFQMHSFALMFAVSQNPRCNRV